MLKIAKPIFALAIALCFSNTTFGNMTYTPPLTQEEIDAVTPPDLLFAPGASSPSSVSGAFNSGFNYSASQAQQAQQIYGSGQPNINVTIQNPAPNPSPSPSNSNIAADVLNNPVMNSCQQAHDAANNCCANPAQCLPGQNNGNADSPASLGYQIFTGILGVATVLPGDSAAMCGRMKDVADVVTVLNLYLAQRCTQAVSACKSACGGGQVYNNTQNCLLLAQSNSDRATCLSSAQLNQELSDCKSFDNATSRALQSAVSSQLAARFSGMCQNLASNTPQVDQFGNPDCTTVANAASPFCQYKCSQAGMSANPTCAGYFAAQSAALNNGLGANGGAGVAAAANGANGGNSQNPFSALQSNAENQQQNPIIPTTAPTQSALSTMTPGAAGGQLPGGGDIGGGSPGLARPSVGGAGWNADILKGIVSGNGYSTGGAQMKTGAGGGYAGYAGVLKTDPLGKPFNLKDFLPGGKNSQVRTTAFRGLASNIADISPAHMDIFQKVTDRFHAVCVRDALYDCDTLQKVMKKPAGP